MVFLEKWAGHRRVAWECTNKRLVIYASHIWSNRVVADGRCRAHKHRTAAIDAAVHLSRSTDDPAPVRWPLILRLRPLTPKSGSGALQGNYPSRSLSLDADQFGPSPLHTPGFYLFVIENTPFTVTIHRFDMPPCMFAHILSLPFLFVH